MRRAMFVLLAGSILIVSLRAQSPASTAPAFEVASIKPNNSGSQSSSGRTTRGSVTITNQTMRSLIVNAYDLRGNRIVGGPGWIDSERFDVMARAPEGTPDNQLSAMLRSLLLERSKLVAHMETREEPIYALVLARADGRLGPSLRPAGDCLKGSIAAGAGLAIPLLEATTQAPCGTRSSSDGRRRIIQGGARTMADLANTLRGTGDREVVDRTGLTGPYDFDLRYAPEALRPTSTDTDDNLPSVFTAVQEQLGLKLESARGPVEYLVIDSIDRPTPD